MSEQGSLDKFDASDFVNLALSPIQSTLGKLSYLAGQRDHDADQLAELLYGKEQIEAALQRRHRETFCAWLGMCLAEQLTAVAEHLAAQSDAEDAPTAQLLQKWLHEKLYEKLIPAAATQWERELFSSDMRSILRLLQIRLDSSGNRNSD